MEQKITLPHFFLWKSQFHFRTAPFSRIFFTPTFFKWWFHTDNLDTYHGVSINIEYFLRGEVKRTRSFLAGAIATPPTEIYVETEAVASSARPKNETKEFLMTPLTITKKKVGTQPLKDFRIKGSLDTTTFRLDSPLTGQSNFELLDLSDLCMICQRCA